MSQFSPRRLLFVINAKAGGTDKSTLPDQIADFGDKKGIEIRIHHKRAKKKKTRHQLEEIIKDFKPDAVVACGGDGTVNMVGRLLVNSETPLGILPLGSSNALAKNLKIPLAIPDAIELLAKGEVKEIDTLDIEGKLCLHIFDLGFNARLIERFDKRHVRGMASYGVAMLQELFKYRFFKYRIETPETVVEGKAFSINITNSKIYGTRATINPKGKMDDGLFEICIIKPFHILALPWMTYQLFRGTLDRSPYSQYITAREATIQNLSNELHHIDGELVELPEKIHIKQMTHSLKVIVPPNDGNDQLSMNNKQ